MKATSVLVSIFLILFFVAPSFAQETEFKIYRINYSKAEELQSIVESLLSEKGKVSVDNRTNSLIVIDTKASLQRISQVLERLDAKEKQIEIKVLITEATDAFLSDIGMNSAQIIIPEGRFAAVLNLIDTADSAKVRSEMTVTTLNNKPAKIQATVNEIFGTLITRYGTHREHEVITPIRQEVGNVLEVLPRANNDGTITVSLSPSASRMDEAGTIQKQAILTQVVINDGDTIAIGGLDSSSDETTRDSIPLLGTSVSKRRTRGNRRVVMFLTANVME